MSDEKQKKQTTINEDAGLPENWVPVETKPMIPGEGMPGAMPAPASQSMVFQTSLAPTFQHDSTFVGTEYGSPRIPKTAIMPLGLQANPITNAAIQSTAKIVAQTTSGGSGGITSVGFTAPKEAVITGSPIGVPGGIINWSWATETPATIFQAPPPGLSGFQGTDQKGGSNGQTITVSMTPTTSTSLGIYSFFGNSSTVSPPGWTGAGSTVFYKEISGTSPVSISQTVQVGSFFLGQALALFGGNPAFVQQTQQSGLFSGVVSYLSNNTSGNTLIVVMQGSGPVGGPASLVMSDSNGNTYTQILNQFTTQSVAIVQEAIFVAPNCFGGANNVSYAFSGGTLTNLKITILEFAALPAGAGIPFFSPLSGSAVPAINLAASGNGGVGGILPVIKGGTGVGSSTGTGNTVLSASPTFTGTVALPIVTTTGKVTNYNSIATVSNGVPSEYAATNLTAQGANVAATTVYAVPSTGAGLYRVTVYLVVSRAATTSSTLPDSRIIFTDRDSGAVITVPLTPGDTGNALTTFQQATFVLNAKANTNIQYDIGQVTPFASVGATSMQFAYHNIVEYLG